VLQNMATHVTNCMCYVQADAQQSDVQTLTQAAICQAAERTQKCHTW
jgi:hypothetical protein